jgi:ligand-binding sensor domain-containing protein/signal transduction histidine kinase
MKSESTLPRKLQLRVYCSGFGSWLTTDKAKRFRGSRHSVALALWLALSIPLLSSTFALDPSLALGQYRLVRWDQDQGLPQNVTAGIAQTQDGFLWLRFGHGLIRFDGKKFDVGKNIQANIELPFDVYSLLLGSSGELWISSWKAMYCRLPNGEFKRFGKEDGVPDDPLQPLFLDKEGLLWVGTENYGLLQFKENRFSTYSGSLDLARHQVYAFSETNDGAVWVATASGIYRLDRKSREIRRFSRIDGLPANDVYGLGVDSSGRLWAGTGLGLAELENGIFQPVSSDLGRLPIQALTTDSHGMIWASIAGGGLWRIDPATGQVSQLPPENGRPLPNIQQIFEDREGNIWLATSEGLERLSDVKVITYTTRDGLPSDNVGTVASGSEGRIWIGTNAGLACLKNGKIERISLGSKEEPVPPIEVTSLYEDPHEVLWFGTRDGGLHRFENGHDQRIAALNREGGPGYAMGICNNRAGDLLVGTAGAGLQVFHHGQLIRTFSSADGLRNRSIFSLTIDREETVWIGETPGVDVLRGSIISVPGENAEMLSKTTILSTYEDPDGTIWAGGVNGLYRLRAGKWAPVAFRPDERVLAPEFYCLLEDDNGNLWSSGSRGIFCVSKGELNEFFDGKRFSVNCRAFGKADGLKSPDCSDVYFPAGCRLPDGRLAFGTIAGLAIIDPNHLRFNSLLPAVRIERVVVDLTHILPPRPENQSVQLGPGAHHLEFDYAGLSFTAPEKVRFKYRLNGFDKDWIDAGTSAEAHYTNLAPGTYRFRVIACNNDGLWVPEQAAATTTIVVQPHFYQTIWFAVLCAAAFILAVWLLGRWRFQQILEERTRLARELHDTVARGTVGLVWRLEAAKSLAKKMQLDPLLTCLDDVSKLARENLKETRRAMRALRSGLLETNVSLPSALEAVMTRTAGGSRLWLQLTVSGAPYPIGSAWEQALVRITEESLTNTLKYAKARQFIAELSYDPGELRIRLRDDGVGFNYKPGADSTSGKTAPDESAMSSGFGLLGIEERCRQLGGGAFIESSPGSGTTIEVIVPRPSPIWGWLSRVGKSAKR